MCHSVGLPESASWGLGQFMKANCPPGLPAIANRLKDRSLVLCGKERYKVHHHDSESTLLAVLSDTVRANAVRARMV